MGLIPGLGRSPREGNGNPLQYSLDEKYHGQEKPGRLHTVQKVAKSRAQLSIHTPKNKYKNK